MTTSLDTSYREATCDHKGRATYRAIILAGGSGSRLYPLTQTVSKQLLPVYDKPMIYYPLSTLLLAGMTEILIISTPQDLPRYRSLLGDGRRWGIELHYCVQKKPQGLAQALTLGADFIGDQNVALILGDNLFHGDALSKTLQKAAQNSSPGATIFGYRVADPQRYGVVDFSPDGRVLDLQEKPLRPKSHFAVVGLYFYDAQAVSLARQLQPSARGELEITDLNRLYLQQGQLRVQMLGRGTAWLDTGTHPSLLQAATFIEAVEQRQGLKIGCIEEVAWRMGRIDQVQLRALAQDMGGSGYGDYLRQLAADGGPRPPQQIAGGRDDCISAIHP